ncbi:hypothetical protein VitviT2T_008579 [Vitis vinifera]|uniref:ATPase AAA-type core domain-containing protein n=1 Tax=Vitis vinifera TaxID=29760 RepID=A0ABY9C2W0_VITVI|nr:hypothetical protein VitviT2T_008579 [Vitis vinifera]
MEDQQEELAMDIKGFKKGEIMHLETPLAMLEKLDAPCPLVEARLGKTTLAHVAAKHCGYRVVEINASDDRSSSTIEAKILDVVQMNFVMADSKPNCLVIDEIDGALGDGKGGVEVILKVVSTERKGNVHVECDICSCLNTLQFLNKKNQTLNVFEISSQVVGQKDMSRSIFDIWKEIFQNRKMKRAKRSDNCCNGRSVIFLVTDVLELVALHLLSERERNDLAQLINAMVSYSITYKNMKSDPLLGTQLHEAASDGLSLSFDPPIADFVTFKGFSLGHYALGVAVKQILMHEIEKNFFLQGSMSKTMDSIDGKRGENWAMTMEEKSRAQSGNVSHAVGCAENNIETTKSKASTSIVSSASGSSGSAEASVKLKSSRDMKKPPRGSTFFDSKGSQTTNLIQEPVTLERDSRPLLFKFNEGFTNAVKRPVQIREFLL